MAQEEHGRRLERTVCKLCAPLSASARHLPQQRHSNALARQHSAQALEGCIGAVAHAERMLDQNVAPPLVCERLAIALTGEVPVH